MLIELTPEQVDAIRLAIEGELEAAWTADYEDAKKTLRSAQKKLEIAALFSCHGDVFEECLRRVECDCANPTGCEGTCTHAKLRQIAERV